MKKSFMQFFEYRSRKICWIRLRCFSMVISSFELFTMAEFSEILFQPEGANFFKPRKKWIYQVSDMWFLMLAITTSISNYAFGPNDLGHKIQVELLEISYFLHLYSTQSIPFTEHTKNDTLKRLNMHECSTFIWISPFKP